MRAAHLSAPARRTIKKEAKVAGLRAEWERAQAALAQERAHAAKEAERRLQARAWAEAKAEAASVCLCPITKDLFRDPVVCKDGHVYERAAIEAAFHKAKGPVLSPVTLEPIADTTLVPVEPIRQMVLGLVEVKILALRNNANIHG